MKRTTWLLVAAIACLCVAIAVPALAGKDKGKKTERNVTLDQVPEKVKDTIVKEAGDNKIEEIEEVSKDGAVVYYEAEWKSGGKEIEIEVAPDGKLLKKEVEDADDDDKDDDKDDD